MKKQIFTFLSIIFIGQFFPSEVLAQWSTDYTVNNPICVTVSRQQAPRLISDGSGGAIITWWDLNLLTSDYNIYAQRISANGIIQWTVNGISICTNAALQHVPEIVSDGKGGAIITWQDNRSGAADIYAQRINGNGIAKWATDGVPVCSATKDQTFPQLINDGKGGAIITWQDLRAGSDYVPYAQRIDSNGVTQWIADGVLLSTGTAETPQIISDGNGGAILTWHQYTGVYPNGNFDIVVQQINANGVLGWGNNGDTLTSLTTNQMRPQITSDGANGAIIVWEDYRNSSSYSNLYAQHMNASGVTQWASEGVNVTPNTQHQIRQKLLSDGSGGAYITWQYGNTNEVFAQRINSSGASQWASNGVSIGGAGDSRYPQIVTDGGTGAIITWYDYRGSGNGDIFAQHINLSGTILWVANGVSVCRNSGAQDFPRIIGDGSGGAIFVWEDDRDDAANSLDVYAQKINFNGGLGVPTGINETAIDNSLLIYPNPFSNELFMNGAVKNGVIIISDVTGKEIIRQKMVCAETKINTQNLSQGFYILNYTDGNKNSIVKLIKL